MGVGQGGTHLPDQPAGRLGVPRSPVQRLAQRPAPQPAGHQIGPVGVAPIVVERDDVGVLQQGDQMGFRFETAHELGAVDELGADHLHRHLPTHRRLIGPIDDPEIARPHPLPQLITPHRADATRQ